MKTKNIIILGALAVASLTTVTSCNDFEDINKDPNKADLEQEEPELSEYPEYGSYLESLFEL